MEDEPGDKTQVMPQLVLAGRWRVDGRLGEGGMGSVLLGFDLTTSQHVAIKMLGLDLVDRAEFVTRFEREARLLAKLHHPNLVPLIAVDKHEGAPFFVMKRVPGQTLDRLIKERGKLTARQAFPLIRQLAEALDFLHARGVVHRDLKPANIMVGDDDRLTLVDFGISQQNNTTRLTMPGMVVGTPLYMAPEQITSDEAGPAADLYALAMLTWHLLVGSHPFEGDRRESMFTLQVKQMPAPANELNPALSVGVGQAIQRSLDKDPERRHPTAVAFYEDLLLNFSVDSTTSEPDAATAPDPGRTRSDKPPIVDASQTVVQLEPTVVSPPASGPPIALLVVAVIALMLLSMLVLILK